MKLFAALKAAAMRARLLTLLPLGEMIHLARNIALVQVTHRVNFNLNLECPVIRKVPSPKANRWCAM